ncbi:MAG: hypothetical protein MO846_02125 [Candidatus Devosia symbiotica]|nr:hypothetical protein [Candidatus Devosia symbiotica]
MSEGSLVSRLWVRIAHDRSIGFGFEYLGLTTLRFPRITALAALAFSIACLAQMPRANVDGDLLRAMLIPVTITMPMSGCRKSSARLKTTSICWSIHPV